MMTYPVKREVSIVSRTVRRKEKWLFQQAVGSFEEWHAPSPGYPFTETVELRKSRESGVSLEWLYAQRVAQFRGDHRSGYYSAPHWFRRLYGSKHVRLVNAQQLHVCNKYDEWDQHAPHPFVSNAGWFWF